MELQDMVEYSTKCMDLLENFLSENSAVWDAEFATMSVYNSIHKIVAHCVGAEERWLVNRVLGEPINGRYEDRAPAEISAVFADWRSLHARFDEAYLLDLQQIIQYDLPQWNTTGSLSKEAMLVHLMLHESSHRGGIMMACQAMNVDPPNFDWPLVMGTPS